MSLLSVIGELAALGTSFGFTTGSIFFTLASRQLGPLVLNRTRLIMALVLITLTHWAIFGTPLPGFAEPQRWLWLGLSGVIGFALGDIFLFAGYAQVGPRMTMLMMSLSPILTTMLAWLFLHETISSWQAVGVAITLSGIVWVVLERNGSAQSQENVNFRRGLLAGLAAATCQSLGLILARQGLGGDFPALSGNVIRLANASVAIWAITVFQGQAGSTLQVLRCHPRAVQFALAGAICGPFLGVSLSLFAIQHAEVGVASTIMALPPVFLLPISYVFFHERYNWQAVAGTLLAIAGIATLFLV